MLNWAMIKDCENNAYKTWYSSLQFFFSISSSTLRTSTPVLSLIWEKAERVDDRYKMPIAKPTRKFQFFFTFLFNTYYSVLKRNACLLFWKQLTLKRSRPSVWSLKTCDNVGFISNLLSWNVFTFRALSLRQITMVLFVYQGLVSRHNKFSKIDFLLTVMVCLDRQISTFIKNKKCDGLWGIYQRPKLAKEYIPKYHFQLSINCWSKGNKF